MICRAAKRRFPRGLSAAALGVMTVGLLLASAHASESGHDDAAPPAVQNEIAAYARLAREAADAGKWPLAEHFITLLVDLPAPDTEKKAALRTIAEVYEKARVLSKAIAVYEKLAELFGTDSDAPEFLFRLGLLYRESGARSLAIARFYSVLNSALKVDGSRGFEAYQALAQKAQIEIAETYLLAGDYAQARKFYNLLARLELPPAERARVRFKAAHCRYLLGEMAATIEETQAFLKEFPEDASAPEGRYLLATALRAQRRPKEALEAVLALLREENARKDKAPERWAFWQKKTGNEFANDFYQQGNFLDALTIYQALAKLSSEPEWQWPVIYQMGLCFERLRLTERAAEAYKYLLDDAKKPGRDPAKLAESVRPLPEMARWRGEQIAWRHDTDAQLSRLLGEPVQSSSR